MPSSTVTLRGVDAKIIRAKEHLVDLENEIVTYLSAGVAKFTANVSRTNRTLRVGLDLITEPPLPLSIIAGDVIHNARSALDHLWGALTRSTQSSFAVYRDINRWNEVKAEALCRVAKGAHELIEGLQPCSRTDDGKLLGLLNTLSNRDKHRLLNLTTTHAKQSRLTFWNKENPGQRFETNIGLLGPFKPNTYIEITDLPDTFIDGGVDVQVKGVMAVAFKDAPLDGENARDLLGAILSALEDRIIPELRRFIKP